MDRSDVTGREFQRRFYDDLVRTKRPTRFGLSCGFEDRFDPALLERRPALKRALSEVFDSVLPDEIGTMLDVGCGTAYYWPLLVERCDLLIGTDLSPAMAATGRRHHLETTGLTAHALCGDATDIPLATSSVDVVLCIDTLHHLESLTDFTLEVSRVLKPGGCLIAVEPNVWNPVVFAAHLLPPEERGAVWPNHPLLITRAIRRCFGSLEARPVTYVSGFDNELALRFVGLADKVLRLKPFSIMALRRIFVARRPGCGHE